MGNEGQAISHGLGDGDGSTHVGGRERGGSLDTASLTADDRSVYREENHHHAPGSSSEASMTHVGSSDSLSASDHSVTDALYDAEAGRSAEGNQNYTCSNSGGGKADGNSHDDDRLYPFEISDHEGQAHSSTRSSKGKGAVAAAGPLRMSWFDRLAHLPYMNRRRVALGLVLMLMTLVALIVILSVSVHKNKGEKNRYEGPPMGATGVYRNVFAEFLRISEPDVDAKLNTVWQKLFYGDPNNESVYVEVDPDMAQIINTESNVVTSEGISYGMTACLHMEKQTQFNRLWNWARLYMQHDQGDYESFFAWRVTRDGQLIDVKDVIPAPDAEAYIATALIAAHRKWNSTENYPYKQEAMRLLEAMADPKKGFFTKDGKVTFNPTDWGALHSNPSYHLPHFYEAWARFLYNEGTPNFNFWNVAAKKSREFLHTAANGKTGLYPDYTTIDGKDAKDPNLNGHQNFQWDAWRAPANVALDWAWWGQDKWQPEYSDRVLSFFYSKGIGKYDSEYTVDGKATEKSTGHDGGLVSMNAVTTLGARKPHLQNAFVKELWDLSVPQGPSRYYPAMLYMMGLLHCSGRFHAYF